MRLGPMRFNTHAADRIFPYLLVIPAILTIFAVYFYPIFLGVDLSLRAVKFIEKAPFVGLKNYQRLIQDPGFWLSVRVTVLYTVLYSIGVFLVGLFTALILNREFKGKLVARTLIILPYAIPDIAAVLIWRWLFDYSFGVFNFILHRLGALNEPVFWLANSSTALLCVVLVSVWRLFPFHSLALLSALQSVPKELYEAGAIDGATPVQSFFHITLPSIRSIAGILLVLTIIWSFRRFTIFWTMTQGGPARATEVLVIQIYLKAFRFYDMGYASAIGTLTVLFLMIIAVYYFKRTSKLENR
jgi:multiple sugar transport system permease protein